MTLHSAPLVMRLKPSRLARAVLLLVFLLALAAIGLADPPLPVRLGAALLAAAITLHAWRVRLPLELKLYPDGRLEWRETASSWQAVSLLPRSAVGPWLCLLACRAEGEKRVRNLTILPDSLAADDFRRLRVWLRWRAAVQGAVPGGDESPDGSATTPLFEGARWRPDRRSTP